MKGVRRHAGWLVSALFLGLVLWRIDWHEFMGAMAKVAPWEIALLCLIYLSGFLVRGVRCRQLLPGLTYAQSLQAVLVGYAANNLLPARLGEVVRAQVVGKSCGLRRTTTLSSILIERCLDGVAIVALLVIGSIGLPLPEWANDVRLAGIVIFSVALAGVLVLGLGHRFWAKFIPAGKAGYILHGLLEGMQLATRNVETVIVVGVASLLTWSLEGVMFYYAFHVFHFDLDFSAALFVLGVVNLGVLIPSSPGNVGVFQFFGVKSLSVFKIAAGPAMAYSVVVHICQYVPVTILGVLSLHRFGFRTFTDVRNSAPDPEGVLPVQGCP